MTRHSNIKHVIVALFMKRVQFGVRKACTLEAHPRLYYFSYKSYTLVRIFKPSIMHSKNRPTNHNVFRSVDMYMLMSHYQLKTSCILRECWIKLHGLRLERD
jgi:hypothetical protein